MKFGLGPWWKKVICWFGNKSVHKYIFWYIFWAEITTKPYHEYNFHSEEGND
jgi:hypothetical protein